MGAIILSASRGALLFLPEHDSSGLQWMSFSPGNIWGCQNIKWLGWGGAHKKYMLGTMIKTLGALGSPKQRVIQSNMECMQTEKPRPIVLLSSFDRWETWGWKGKHSTELLPRNRGLSWDSNTAQYNSKTLTPSYQICCLVPLCRLVASPTYHFSMRQSAKWDSEFLCLRWCWLLPLSPFRFSPESIAQMSRILPMSIPERLPSQPSLGVRWCLTKTLSLFCFYYSTSKREFLEQSPSVMTFRLLRRK